VRQFVIPEIFFKTIAEKGKLYSRIWFYWLSEFVDEIFEPDFIEKQEKNLNKYSVSVSEIREIYQIGVQLLQQDFKIIEKKNKKPSKPINKELVEISEKVLEYLNSKAGSTFSTKGSNIELVAARVSEGFNLADFKFVIDRKVLDWKGTDWEKYLRPITLFSKSKFENYLNANLNEPKRSSSNFSKFADSAERAKQLIGLYTK
jgi:uncharacterized phage protein (TIGR02220 family)